MQLPAKMHATKLLASYRVARLALVPGTFMFQENLASLAACKDKTRMNSEQVFQEI